MAIDKNGLQLLPETRHKIDVKIPGENRLIYIGMALLILVAAVATGLYFYKNSLQDELLVLDLEIANLEKSRDKKSEANILTLDKQLALVSNLLEGHVTWSKAFSKVESLIQPQVQFLSFSAAVAENRFEFKAVAPHYTAIAKQVSAFTSDESIKDLSLTNVHVLTTGKLEFSVKLEFDKAKFLTE